MWRPEDLGCPIPNSEHAVSVCLPTWADNVGYEEADPNVVDRMRAGYPRFFVPRIVRNMQQRLIERCGATGQSFLPFASRKTARRCCEYLEYRSKVTGRILDVGHGLFAVAVPDCNFAPLKEFWQHSGEGVSTRAVTHWMDGQGASRSDCDAKQSVRQRLADFSGADPADVLLFPSGIAAIYCAWRAMSRLAPGRDRPTIQFGFPYVDTLKILERFDPNAVVFYPNGNLHELNELQSLTACQPKGLFCEIPSNPLLRTPDLIALNEFAAAHEVPILVDDTLAALTNLDVLPHADLLATSLTKFFSGAGDVLAGALILNKQRSAYSALKSAVIDEFEDLLFDADAEVLEANSRDVVQRVARINETAQQVCSALRSHPKIENVFYPEYETTELYQEWMKPGAGFGGLFSVTLRNGEQMPHVFDALRISKGPNLGTNFSLCCPYTLLAHYDELAFAEDCGVSRHLLRVSVGLEEPNWLIEQFQHALDVGCD